MEEEKEFPHHINMLTSDHAFRSKILRMQGEIKAIAKESPELSVFYDEVDNDFKFICTAFGYEPKRLPIDYQYNSDIDKKFLLKQMFQTAYSLGYEQKGKDVQDALKNLLEL